ncbi:MAG: cytochrome c maturation protein CcmE [Alphaproteobacteria bacterium]|nr:cytochrome c maturation protein CcmE [Alphaproteobacteria bacterium]
MKPKRRRLYFALFGLAALGGAATLVFYALDDSLLFFYTPAQLAERNVAVGTNFRLGGLVVEGSVRKEGTTTHFTVTDFEQTIDVSYVGVLPDLFREGQGVITDGALDENRIFIARQVLAKHDETYMPKDVADALKERGVWQPGEPEPSQ